jgi:hypothetical protein
MVVLNKNKKDVELDLSRFDEIIKGESSGKDIISGRIIELDSGMLDSPSLTPMIIEIPRQ